MNSVDMTFAIADAPFESGWCREADRHSNQTYRPASPEPRRSLPGRDAGSAEERACYPIVMRFR